MSRTAIFIRLCAVHRSKLWHWVYQMAAVSLMFTLICPASTTCPEGSSRTPCYSSSVAGLGRIFRMLLLPIFLLVMLSKPPPFFIDVKVCCAAFLSCCYSLRRYLFFSCRHERTLSFLMCRSVGWRLFCIMQKFTVKTHIIQKKLYCTTIIIY